MCIVLKAASSASSLSVLLLPNGWRAGGRAVVVLDAGAVAFWVEGISGHGDGGGKY